MSKTERREDRASRGFMAAQMGFATDLMLASFKMNPFLNNSSSRGREKDRGKRNRKKEWRFSTKRELRKLVDEGVLEEPDKYGFSDFREMKKFLRGRHDESNNSFKSSRSEREEIQQDAPRQVSIDQAMQSFTSAFYPEAEEVQILLESAGNAEYWELADTMPQLMEEYSRLVTEGEAELSLTSGEEELMLRFQSGDGLYPETIEALYRTGEETYDIQLDNHADLPEELDQIPENF